jgi:nucleotide-binding universal stress UspA family protein
MNVLVCVARVSEKEPKLWFGETCSSVGRVNKLTLLHVSSHDEDQTTGEESLKLALGMLKSEEVELRLRRGDPAEQILAELKEKVYDLVVLGPNESPRLKRHILGSVTGHVIRHATTSVLIARQARQRLKHILICSGGADIAEQVIEEGAWLAQKIGAQVTLLHVATPVASMYAGLDELDETLSELLQTDTPIARHLRHSAEILKRRGVSAELKLRYGTPGDEIIREAREADPDLIVIGASKSAPRLKRWMLGDVTWQVVEHAPRSVLVIKNDEWRMGNVE